MQRRNSYQGFQFLMILSWLAIVVFTCRFLGLTDPSRTAKVKVVFIFFKIQKIRFDFSHHGFRSHREKINTSNRWVLKSTYLLRVKRRLKWHSSQHQTDLDKDRPQLQNPCDPVILERPRPYSLCCYSFLCHALVTHVGLNHERRVFIEPEKTIFFFSLQATLDFSNAKKQQKQRKKASYNILYIIL